MDGIIMAKTQKYLVVKKHTLGHAIGDELSLTDLQAKSLVGKIKLKSDGAIDKAKTDLVGKLKKENKKLTDENTDLLAEVAVLNEAGEAMGLKLDELKAEVEELKKADK